MRLFKSALLLSLCLILLSACSVTYDPQADISALDAKLEEFIAMVEAEDVDGIMGQYSKDLEPEAYMVYGNLKGAEAVRESWETFFADSDVMEAEVLEKHHKLDRNLAVSYGFWRVKTSVGEMEQEMEGRFTNVLGKRQGRWDLLTTHISVPLPMPAKPEVEAATEE